MKTGKIFGAGALSMVILATSLAPVQAAPIPSAKTHEVSSVEQVQYRRYHRDRRGWYNGERGYRDRRPGYRRHSDGYWYPLAAFGAGAIIGGAIAGRSTTDRLSNRHIRWCADRYRTYRPSDNTFVLRAGVRAQCNSPFN